MHHCSDHKIVVQHDDIGQRADFESSDVGQSQGTGRRARHHGGRVRQRHPELVHCAPETVREAGVAAGQRPASPLTNLASADLDVVVTHAIGAVWQATCRYGVADEGEPMAPSRPDQSRGHRIVQMDAVVDQFQDDAVTLHEGENDTWFTVMDRAHAVAQMGRVRSAGIKRCGGNGVLGIGMSERGDGTVIDNHPHRLDAADELGRQRHHAHRAPTEGEQPADFRPVGRTQMPWRVRAGTQRGQPGPLEMNPRKGTGLDERGDVGQLRLQGWR